MQKKSYQLTESMEEVFFEIIQTSNSIILKWNLEEGITFINRYGESFFEYEVGELIGKTVMILVPEIESTGRDLKQLAEDIVLNPKQYENFENENVRKNGERVWIAWSNKAVVSASGKLDVIAIGNDITDRKRDERQLKENEKQFERYECELKEEKEKSEWILESISDAFFSIDRNWRYIYINETAEKIQERRREDLLGKDIRELYPDHEAQRFFKKYADAMESGETVTFEEFYGPLNVWLEVRVYPSSEGLSIYYRDISERKKWEESNLAQKELLQAIIDHIPVMITVYDPELKKIQINREVERVTGWSQEDADSHGLMRLVYPDVAYREMVEEYMLSLKPGWRDLRMVVKNGARVETSWANIALSGNRQVGIGIDISHRKKAEREIRESEERFKAISEAAFEGIMIHDHQRILDFNETFSRMFGYSRNDLLGCSLQQLYTKESYEKIPEQKEKDSEAALEIIARKKEGSTFLAQIREKDIFYKGMPARTMTVHDITNQREWEETIKRSRSILAQAGQMANLGAWEIEIENSEEIFENPLIWSDQVYRIFGLEPGGEKVTNDFFLSRVHPEDREKIIFELYQSVKKKKPYSIEHRIILRDGSERIVLEHALISFSETGQPKHITGAIQDITERKRIETELLRLKVELEQRVEERTSELAQANRELEAFSYTVSHDLRAPLRHVMSFMALLNQHAHALLDEKSLRYMKIISDSAQRMSGLIDDLLAFSRISRVDMVKRNVDLNRIFAEVRDELSYELADRNVKLNTSSLPVVRGDLALLRTVMMNLLSNALKYTRNRDTAIIEIACKEEYNYFLFFVKDNGVGFDMRFEDKLFEVFQRLHRSEEFEGTGIGLASVRRIIQRHGGKVWAEGVVNQGATFYFTLPK